MPMLLSSLCRKMDGKSDAYEKYQVLITPSSNLPTFHIPSVLGQKRGPHGDLCKPQTPPCPQKKSNQTITFPMELSPARFAELKDKDS